MALCTALTMTLGMAACGENKTVSESKAEETSSAAAKTESQAEKLPETDEEWDEAMINTAMTSYGNTKMMQDVIAKAQSGE